MASRGPLAFGRLQENAFAAHSWFSLLNEAAQIFKLLSGSWLTAPIPVKLLGPVVMPPDASSYTSGYPLVPEQLANTDAEGCMVALDTGATALSALFPWPSILVTYHCVLATRKILFGHLRPGKDFARFLSFRLCHQPILLDRLPLMALPHALPVADLLQLSVLPTNQAVGLSFGCHILWHLRFSFPPRTDSGRKDSRLLVSLLSLRSARPPVYLRRKRRQRNRLGLSSRTNRHTC